jgi:hypothetical protein
MNGFWEGPPGSPEWPETDRQKMADDIARAVNTDAPPPISPWLIAGLFVVGVLLLKKGALSV